MANLIEIILLAVDEASGTIARVAGETEAMGGGAMAMGTAMLTAGAAATALALGIGKIAESGAEFQQFTQEIANNTTMNTDQLGAMRTAILQMSEDGGIAYEKLGTAFMKVMNITNDAANSQEILQVAMESAVATGGNVTSIANVLANAMHEYSLDVQDVNGHVFTLAEVQANAAHVMGVMHLAAAEGNMTLEQFSEASGRSIGIAANLGVSLEDVSAAFASLTKHGFDASTAGTQVVNILTHMINPTQAARKELELLSQKTGIDLVGDFSAAGVSSKGLEGVLDDLKQAFTKLGLTEAEGEQEALKLINAQRGGLGLGTLLGTAWGDYNSILKDLNDTQMVNTITEDQYNKVREQAVNQWQRLQQTVRATAITIGVEMLPVANALLERALAVATGVLHWAQAHADLVGPLLATIGVVSAVIGIVLLLGGALTIAGAAIAPILTGLGILAGLLTGPVIASLVVAGTFLGVFRNQLAAIGGLALATGQAVIKAFTSGDFNAAFGSIITAVQHAFGPEAAGAVTLFVSHVLSGLQTLRDAALTFAQAVSGNWFGAQTESINGFVRAVGVVGTYAHDIIVTFAQALRGEWAGGATESINAVVRAVGNLGLTLNTFGPLAARAVGLVADAFHLLTGGQVEGGLAGFVGRLVSWEVEVGGVLGSLLGQVVSWQLRIATAFANWLAGALPGMLTGLAQLVAGIGDSLRGVQAPKLGQLVSESFGPQFAKWVGPAIPPLMEALGKLFDALGTWINDNRPKIEAKLGEWGIAFKGWVDTTAWPFMKDQLDVLLGKFLGWIENDAAPQIKAKADTWGDALDGWLKDILPPWATDWGNLKNQVDISLGDIGDSIQRFAARGDLVEWIDGWLPAWAGDWDNFSNDARVALGDLASALGSFASDRANDLGAWLLNILPAWATDWDDFSNDARQGLQNITSAIGTFIGDRANDLNVWIMSWSPDWLKNWNALGTAVHSALTSMQLAVSGGLSAIGILFAALPGRIAGALGDLGGLLVGAGRQVIDGLIAGIQSGLGALGDALGNITQFIKDHKGPPEYDAIMLFNSGRLIMQGLIAGMSSQDADLAKKLADVTSGIAKAITDMIGAMKALANFDQASAPGQGQIGGFVTMVAGIVASIVVAAAQFKAEGLKAASDFSDTASKIFGFFANALAAMKALPDMVTPTFQQAHAFALAVGMIVQELMWVASFFATEGLTQAGVFADAAGKVLGLVGTALKAIADLATATALSVSYAAVHQLALTIGMIVQELQWVASFFKEQGLAQTASFADTASKVLGLVGNAITAILKLPEISDPGFPAIHLFATVIATIVQELGNVASFFKDQALTAAAGFSDSATKVLALFGNGIVDGLMKLADFVAPSQKAIDNFLAVVFYVVQRFAEAASRLSTDGIKATTDFSNAANAALQATTAGVNAFKDLTKLVVPSKEAIDNLLIAVNYVVDRMLDMANQMTTAGIARVTAFGTASSTVAKGITDVMDLFKKLGEKPYKDMLSTGMAAVMADFNLALTAIQTLASQSVAFLASATKFSDNMQQAASAIHDAVAAANSVQGLSIPSLPSAPSGGSNSGGGTIIGNPKQGHADGGYIVPGQSYTVGERGSETFVSDAPGWIVPHGTFDSGGGGDTLQANFSFNLDGQRVTDVVYTRLLRMRRNKPSLGLT